jgi:hypothetical protein
MKRGDDANVNDHFNFDFWEQPTHAKASGII